MRSDEWTTPKKLFKWLDDKCNFEIDAAANSRNALCSKYFSKSTNFLKNFKDYVLEDKAKAYTRPTIRVFCNPPYTLDREFAELLYFYFYTERVNSVLLLPVRADRIWYNELANKRRVRDIPFTGRLHFGNAISGAFMYSVLFVIGFKDVKFPKYLDAGQFNKGNRGSATT